MQTIFKQKAFKIIHIDMDCFYAQIEMRDNPSLAGKPIAIGGPSKTKGILCTSNYEARRYGVKSAQPTFQAFQLCPQLVLLSPNMEKYKSVALQLKAIFDLFSDKVQTISLDEAYIDVTNSKLCGGSATLIAQEIKKKIFEKTGLTASAGVSFNKMLAKIASDWNKPDGLYVITPKMKDAFIQDLPLKKIPGIGKVSYAKYSDLGFKVCRDITQKNIFELIRLFGKRTALEMHRSCSGICNSEVKDREHRKSFGIEKTFYTPLLNREQIDNQLYTLSKTYLGRLKTLDSYHTVLRQVSHIAIKIRFDDFTTHTKEKPVDQKTSNTILHHRQIDEECLSELKNLVLTSLDEHNKPVRLLGIGIKLIDQTHEQLDLDWS